MNHGPILLMWAMTIRALPLMSLVSENLFHFILRDGGINVGTP